MGDFRSPDIGGGDQDWCMRCSLREEEFAMDMCTNVRNALRVDRGELVCCEHVSELVSFAAADQDESQTGGSLGPILLAFSARRSTSTSAVYHLGVGMLSCLCCVVARM